MLEAYEYLMSEARHRYEITNTRLEKNPESLQRFAKDYLFLLRAGEAYAIAAGKLAQQRGETLKRGTSKWWTLERRAGYLQSDIRSLIKKISE